MFRIESAGPSFGAERRVVDDERDVYLQFVSGIAMEPGTVFKLVWGDRVIPFEAITDHHQDSAGGQEYYLTRFSTFGVSVTAATRDDIKPYRFRDPEERRQAQVLAVEALLLFGSHYDGDKRPEGYNRVELEEQVYTKKDFGIP